MLNIFAHSFMTATRLDSPKITEAPKPRRKPRWTAPAYWRMRPERRVDLDNL